jgi:hypothetical protein
MLHGVQYSHVQDRIAELTESKQLKYGITFDKVSRDLQMIRDAALEDGAYGPAVQAEMGRAKLAGLMVDKKEIKTGKIDSMDRGEVEARLRALIDKHELASQLQGEAIVVEGEIEDGEYEEEDHREEEGIDEDLDDEQYGEEFGEDYGEEYGGEGEDATPSTPPA